MKKDDTVYLRHILDSIDSIEKYLKGISNEKFMQDKLIQDGIIRRLEIIGEASRNISQVFRELHPEISWVQIISLRNRVIHEYFDVDLNIVWDISKNDIPRLKQDIESIFNEKI